jgi:uncharacterized membrane protein
MGRRSATLLPPARVRRVVAAEDALQFVPWPLVLAGGSILVVVLFFRRRFELFRDIGLSRAELAILCLGPVAGITVNVPVYQTGGGILAVNLGGALLPGFMVALWFRRAKMDPFLALAGTLLVSAVAFLIVQFDPEQGIYTTFPQLFAPSLVALAFAMAVSVTRPLRAVPLAYTAGCMGALLGADIYNLPPIVQHLGAVAQPSVVSIGGAGVFDMVYLSGMVAMAAAILLTASIHPRRAPAAFAYPGPPVVATEPAAVWQRYQALADPNPREVARAALALSDLHLRRKDHAKCLEHAVLAVDAMLAHPGLLAHVRAEAGPELRADIDALASARALAVQHQVPRRVAGNANRAAKQVVATLEAMAGLASRLEVAA